MGKEISPIVEVRGQKFSIWCDICNKPAERYKVETPVVSVCIDRLMREKQHSGEIILTVECHGKQWRASNWRGRLPHSPIE